MARAGSTNSGRWGDATVRAGERGASHLTISENYAGSNVRIPLFIWRGKKKGPKVLVTAAVHGDEINGTGAIRQLIMTPSFELLAGTLILVPVVNLLGFERHSRYLPDRRDLNRCFPGTSEGSLASRFAKAFFDNIVRRCDYAIDLHTAAVRRTNFPNVRADMTGTKLAAFARAFGAELIVNNEGTKGSLRQSACAAGCTTLTLEAGEVWKVEPAVVEFALRGIHNCLAHLEMIDGEPSQPAYLIETDATKWVRAKHGGFLQFHVAPGTIVEQDEPIATNTSLTGEEQNVIVAPREGVVLGMTTLPSVAPGDPVCHLAFPRHGTLRKIERVVREMADDSLHQRLREDLARNMLVTDVAEEAEDA
jgi:uncharacterized protein